MAIGTNPWQPTKQQQPKQTEHEMKTLFTLLIVFTIYAIASQNDGPTAHAQTKTYSTKTSTPKPDNWSYYSQTDDMTGGNVKRARIQSTNTLNFSFPYSGAQQGSLTIRTHPRYGKDVILQIEKGQMLCSSYDGCSVLIRFDDGKPVKYRANEPADNSTETLFIRGYSGLVSKIKKAKKMRVSFNVYHEGAPMLVFDVKGFDSGKYLGVAMSKNQKVQKLVGATPDGKIGPATRKKMSAYCEKHDLSSCTINALVLRAK